MSTLPDATELLARMSAGETTAEAVMVTHLARLNAVQTRHNAATQVMAAHAMAEACDPLPGPLSGLPLSVKETFDLAGETVTAGSWRRRPTRARDDAAVVETLRTAGAIVHCRSNVPELAMAGETDNPRFGRTGNALDPDRTAGGSSGGEGVLVATGASAIGIGSDLLGSIRIPAAFNGIVGFRPASGSVNRRGTWPPLSSASPLSHWLSVGPLTRSVRDARRVSGVILNTPRLPSPAGVAGLRLIHPDPFYLRIDDPVIAHAWQHARTALADAGMRVTPTPFPDVPRWFGLLQQLLVHELVPALQRELSPPDAPPFSIWHELFARLKGRPTIYGGLFQLLLLSPLVRPRAIAVPGIVATLDAARQQTQTSLGSDGVLLLPTLGCLAPRHGQMNRQSLRPGVNGRMTPVTFANIMDLPAITVPAPAHRDPATGLVPALMLACAPGAEGALFDVAAVLEAALAD